MLRRIEILCLLTLTVSATGCVRDVDATVAARFLRIEEEFQTASTPDAFLRIAAKYQELIDDGVRSGVIFYNQGNAFVRAGKPGRAVASYRRAQHYRPHDPQLAANLKSVLNPTVGPPPPSLLGRLIFWRNWLSYGWKYQLSSIAALLTFACACVSLFRPLRLWRRLSVALLLLTGLLVLTAAYDWYRFEYLTHGVIIQDDVIVRKGNNSNYQPAFGTPLRETTEFVLLQRRGNWLEIRLRGDQHGWIPAGTAKLY